MSLLVADICGVSYKHLLVTGFWFSSHSQSTPPGSRSRYVTQDWPVEALCLPGLMFDSGIPGGPMKLSQDLCGLKRKEIFSFCADGWAISSFWGLLQEDGHARDEGREDEPQYHWLSPGSHSDGSLYRWANKTPPTLVYKLTHGGFCHYR